MASDWVLSPAGRGKKAGPVALSSPLPAALPIISAGFLFYAFGMVVTLSFNGAGDTRTPTLINFGCFWLPELPVAWVLARPLSLGPKGVLIAVLVDFSTMAIVSARPHGGERRHSSVAAPGSASRSEVSARGHRRRRRSR